MDDVFARETDTLAEPKLGSGALAIVHGSLPHGWTVGDDGARLTLLTDAEVFGFTKQRRAPPRRGSSRDAFLAEPEVEAPLHGVDHARLEERSGR